VTFRDKLHEVIFGHETTAGRAFDVVLIVAIIASVLVVMLDSVRSIAIEYRTLFITAEWVFTALFTVEYGLRLYSARDRGRYARSFFGVIDLLAILPTYLAVILPSSRYFIIVRIFRVLRVFRVLKLASYLGEASVLGKALRASRYKIAVFLLTVLTLVVVIGALMYLVEGQGSQFTSIPRGIYWAVVTLTTVGYGDIAPQTTLGQGLASLVMILGYGIIAVPTGIVTVELDRAARRGTAGRCPQCHVEGHDADATFCKYCGARLRSGP
jgi:voltage-gated potassium channel